MSSVSSENLLTPAQASAMLRVLSMSKIEALARKSTTLGTSDGPITDESFASILSKAKVSFSSNKTWFMNIEINPTDVRPLEYVTLVYPRSSWAFNVGPGGNFAQIAWKTGDKYPNGITVEIQPGRGSDSDPCWLKTVRSPTDLELVWQVQLWKSQFTNPRNAEYAVSGRPVAWESAVEIHYLLDSKWAAFASGREDLVKKKSTNGPSASMFLSARRSVFLSNVATQDEGRASEYDDTFKLLPLLSDPDLRYNRVPEVLVFNADTKTYHPMSFHQLHRLGPGLVMLMTVTPVAFSWGGKQHADRKADLSWEYRLLNITVVGRREAEAVSSPTKMVVKRKVVDLGLDSDDELTKKAKTKSLGKAASSGGSAAASSSVGSGPPSGGAGEPGVGGGRRGRASAGGPAPSGLPQKTGQIERTIDRELTDKEAKFKMYVLDGVCCCQSLFRSRSLLVNFEKECQALQKDSKSYWDAMRAMTAAQTRIADTLETFYGAADRTSEGAMAGHAYKRSAFIPGSPVIVILCVPRIRWGTQPVFKGKTVRFWVEGSRRSRGSISAIVLESASESGIAGYTHLRASASGTERAERCGEGLRVASLGAESRRRRAQTVGRTHGLQKKYALETRGAAGAARENARKSAMEKTSGAVVETNMWVNLPRIYPAIRGTLPYQISRVPLRRTHVIPVLHICLCPGFWNGSDDGEGIVHPTTEIPVHLGGDSKYDLEPVMTPRNLH
ncbi:hypothetical protein K438DRAFT_1993264 [Mycena galopus ATCC 62051]|nr:hypothetical protein K438DRAFT_1993264 [Mycena galopus ATCC 62051]